MAVKLCEQNEKRKNTEIIGANPTLCRLPLKEQIAGIIESLRVDVKDK